MPPEEDKTGEMTPSPEKKATSPVDSALDLQGRELIVLHEVISKLTARVEPCLTSELPETPKDDPNKPSEERSGLVTTIHTKTGTVMHATYRIKRLIERIQL